MDLSTRSGTVGFQRWALRLVALTLAWNVVEGVVALGAGLPAGSIALVGFGLDSCIEVFAAGVVLWRLLATDGADEAAERRAVFLIGVSFFVLAGYMVLEAGRTLYAREAPEASAPGLVLAALSLVVMPALALGKRWTARRLGSVSLEAESTETFICAYLSFTLLLGLGLNAVAGWWWADPAAALAMVGFVLREGWEAVTKRDLCCDV
ncbi:MAG TPA: cation transporter [Dehalococcoidia bacterium]